MIVKKSDYFERQEIKLDDKQKETLDDVVWLLKQDPILGNERKGPLKGVWDYKYEDSVGKMMVCYKFTQETLYLLGVFQISKII